MADALRTKVSPLKTRLFVKKSSFPVSVAELFAWHERPGALERLSPPWDPVRVLARSGGIETGAEARLRVRIGPLAVTWHAHHVDYVQNRLFRDQQLRGPFKVWRHTHLFEPIGAHRSMLEDRIEYALPGPALVTRVGGRRVEGILERVFRYRHQTLAADLETISRYRSRPLRIVVSGASGVLGSALVPFLSCAGHQVIRLVRRPVRERVNEAAWDPDAGRLDPGIFDGVDAVVHLCGENIGRGRWTAARKRRIIDSRVQSTRLLASTLSRLRTPPPVLLSASAIGYYGDRGSSSLLEDAGRGRAFVSEVCARWEQASAPARECGGIRVVQLRIGVVLTPRGGALAEMLPAYRLGLGGPIGDGGQFLSWIHVDDLVGAIHHALCTPELAGPVNVSAPSAIRQRDFAADLGAVLGRPARLALAPILIRTLYGQKGEEILLAGSRVFPHKLLQTGYRFRYPELRSALRHLLGLPLPC